MQVTKEGDRMECNRPNDELQHYGIPGMKWGVRRNIRTLTYHRRNQSINDARLNYKKGNISRSEKRAEIKKAKHNRKLESKQMLRSVKSAKTREEFKNAKQNISKQAVSEVPLNTVKKGATTVNKLLAGVNTGTTLGLGLGLAATAATGPLAGIALTASVVGASAEVGAHYLIQKGINRIT